MGDARIQDRGKHRGEKNRCAGSSMWKIMGLPTLRRRVIIFLSVMVFMCAVVGMAGGEVVNQVRGGRRLRGAAECSCLSRIPNQWRLSTDHIRSLRLRGGSEAGQMSASPGHGQDGGAGEEDDDEVEMADEQADGEELRNAEHEGEESGSEARVDDGVVMAVDSGDMDAAGEMAEDYMQSSDSEKVDEDGMPCNTNFTGDNSR